MLMLNHIGSIASCLCDHRCYMAKGNFKLSDDCSPHLCFASLIHADLLSKPLCTPRAHKKIERREEHVTSLYTGGADKFSTYAIMGSSHAVLRELIDW